MATMFTNNEGVRTQQNAPLFSCLRLHSYWQRFSIVLCLLILAGLMTGCTKPLPSDKMAYAGEWQGPHIYLFISPSGDVEYERQQGATTTSITGAINAFDGNSFSVGFAFITADFEVSTPPYQAQGQWHMVVDGEKLTKLH